MMIAAMAGPVFQEVPRLVKTALNENSMPRTVRRVAPHRHSHHRPPHGRRRRRPTPSADGHPPRTRPAHP